MLTVERNNERIIGHQGIITINNDYEWQVVVVVVVVVVVGWCVAHGMAQSNSWKI